MSGIEVRVDPSLKAEYIDESIESLDQVTALLVGLEKGIESNEVFENIFRPVHSVKGSAAYFGLLKVASLAHELESVLDKMRTGALDVSSRVVDVLIKGVDYLQDIFRRVAAQESEIRDVSSFEAIIEEIKSIALHELATEEQLWLHLFEELSKQSEDGKSLSSVFEVASTLAVLTEGGRVALKEFNGQHEGILPVELEQLRVMFKASEVPDLTMARELIDRAIEIAGENPVADFLKELEEELVMLAKTVGIKDDVTRHALLSRLDHIVKDGLWPVEHSSNESGSEEIVENRVEENSASPSKKGNERVLEKTMRIPEKSIDQFLSHVGEMVTLREMYTNLYVWMQSGVEGIKASRELHDINEVFHDVSASLLNSVMDIRKVPVGNLINRAPRLARDVAGAKGKEIEVTVIGDDIMVDKSIVDTLEAPLVHMIRNAADHGIEVPQERIKCGKPEKGAIRVEVKEGVEMLTLTISDDGKGIDIEKLQAKAQSIGLISESAALSESALIDLLFQSGVSTAEEVSDISGRGVGMDVVKQNIVKVGGTISINTSQGQGSVFTVELPKSVSTQVINAYIINVGGIKYVLPLNAVLRCFKPCAEEYVTVKGQGEGIVKGGEVISLIRLRELLLGEKPVRTYESLSEGVVVEIESDSSTLALSIDSVDSIRQVVLKEIQGLGEGHEYFIGGAIMGDRSVAMVLDMEKIHQLRSGVGIFRTP